MPTFTKEQEKRKEALIQVCRETQGGYIPSHHGSGSWATTYSDPFIQAVKELGELYREAGYRWPIGQISEDLKNAGVRSCRGKEMTWERVRYLWETHIE